MRMYTDHCPLGLGYIQVVSWFEDLHLESIMSSKKSKKLEIEELSMEAQCRIIHLHEIDIYLYIPFPHFISLFGLSINLYKYVFKAMECFIFSICILLSGLPLAQKVRCMLGCVIYYSHYINCFIHACVIACLMHIFFFKSDLSKVLEHHWEKKLKM